MIAPTNGESRPGAGGSPNYVTTASVPVSPDLAASLATNLRAAQSLVRTLEDQRREVARAYAAGYRDAGSDLASAAADAWEAGWDACEADMAEEWSKLARNVRALGSPSYRTHAERRTAELADVAPRQGDFLGVERDPRCLDRFGATVGTVTERRAAA